MTCLMDKCIQFEIHRRVLQGDHNKETYKMIRIIDFTNVISIVDGSFLSEDGEQHAGQSG